MEIPLFPLNTVLCPGIVIPLHIFEERYRALTRRCLETGQPFGVVLIRTGREVGPHRVDALASVGSFTEIREAGRYSDGRYDLLAAATGRFAIRSVDATQEPFLVADVTPLDEPVGNEPQAERLAAVAIRRFVRYLDLMRARDGESVEALDIRVEFDPPAGAARGSSPAGDTADELTAVADVHLEPAVEQGEPAPERAELTIPDDPTVLSHLLSGIVQVEVPRRQELLEADTSVDRLETLITLLERELLLLARRLRVFAPDLRALDGARLS
jgi:Lon protease-like protein